MDVLYQIMIDYGVFGFFIATFLAGSFIPFSSEVVMIALITAGVDPVGLFFWGTVGNTLGSVFNYWLGRLGNPRWIEKWARVTPEQMDRGLHFVERYGFWAGWLAWVPLLGSVITVALGFLRVNVVAAISTIAIGKFVRYLVLVEAWRLAA